MRVRAVGHKYVLDTNLFIESFRDARSNDELRLFHQLFAPFEYLSAVVIQELRSGVNSAVHLRKLEKHVLAPFARRGRLIVPSLRAWQSSGDVLAELRRRRKLDPGRVSKSFGNDILLALSCREAGMTLVTRNDRDFRCIQQIVPFSFIAPWPLAAR